MQILHESNFKFVSLLLKEQIVFLGTQIEAQLANVIVAQLLYLNSMDKKHAFFILNSPDGHLYAGLAIYDTMQMIEAPV